MMWNLLVHVFHANTLTKEIATKFVTHQKSLPSLSNHFSQCYKLKMYMCLRHGLERLDVSIVGMTYDTLICG